MKNTYHHPPPRRPSSAREATVRSEVKPDPMNPPLLGIMDKEEDIDEAGGEVPLKQLNGRLALRRPKTEIPRQKERKIFNRCEVYQKEISLTTLRILLPSVL